MGLGGISVADMLAYWQADPIGSARRFFVIVRALDSVYIEHQNKRTPAN